MAVIGEIRFLVNGKILTLDSKPGLGLKENNETDSSQLLGKKAKNGPIELNVNGASYPNMPRRRPHWLELLAE